MKQVKTTIKELELLKQEMKVNLLRKNLVKETKMLIELRRDKDVKKIN